MRTALFLMLLMSLTGCGATAPPVAPKTPFDRTLLAAERTLRDLHFEIDRIDHRSGTVTTKPLISPQPPELLWRRDAPTPRDALNSALATYRRTAKVTIAEDGTPAAEVVVERQSLAERRVVDPAFAPDLFRRGPERGTPESDRGEYLPYTYFYKVGRDENLEQHITTQTTANAS